jgi:hypothetical protein
MLTGPLLGGRTVALLCPAWANRMNRTPLRDNVAPTVPATVEVRAQAVRAAKIAGARNIWLIRLSPLQDLPALYSIKRNLAMPRCYQQYSLVS